MIFKDRQEAGEQLAIRLSGYKNLDNALVLALPRGGVVVGFKVAESLNLPLDILCPRKIGAPFNKEFAIGAITETGEGVFSKEVIAEMGISQSYIVTEVEKEKQVAAQRLKQYRKNREKRNLKDKVVILVDDGLATGATMRAAIKTARSEKAKKIIVAIPVAPPETLAKIRQEVDDLICLHSPIAFFAVGQFYENFNQTSDEEVITLLDKSYK